jgi:protein-arginine kinase activator protein McsA
MMFNHQPLCEICGERAATIFITRMDGGQPLNQSMCEECAREQTQGEEWLQAMAQKFGLPEDATLEDVMAGLAEQMPEVGLHAEIAQFEMGEEADESTFSDGGDMPAIILEANLQFISEFPSDEDEADELDEAWDEAEESTSDETLDESLFQSLKDSVQMDWPMPEGFLSPALSADKPAKEGAREVAGERCPKCGTTWDRLREDGRAGCAQCYVAFHDRLLEVMNRMQRDSQHVGKVPRAAQKRRHRLEHLRARRDHRLDMLNRRLREAVAAENYEDAAKLRDKIKIVSSTIVSDQT